MNGSLLFVSSIIMLVNVTSSCPPKCRCHPFSKTVDCKNRGLLEVPSNLPADTQVLLLSDNYIQKLGEEPFNGTQMLIILDLSNNSISDLLPETFKGLQHLQILNLTKNVIKYVDNKTFRFLPHLRELDLSSNNISSLLGILGKNTENITLLSLKYNQLKKVERFLLESLPNLKSILLKGNFWQCNCQILGLKLWLESFLYRGGIIEDVICSTPENWKGNDLLKIPYELFGTCSPTLPQGPQACPHHSLEGKDSVKPPNLSEPGENSPCSRCEPKPKPRPSRLRHATATIVITGVVCGTICLMMLAAAGYGCVYAAITAKYQQENSYVGEKKGGCEEKEPFESSLA